MHPYRYIFNYCESVQIRIVRQTFDTFLFLAIDGTIAFSLRYSCSRTEAWRYLRQTFCPASIGGLERPLTRFISRSISIFNILPKYSRLTVSKDDNTTCRM